MNHEDLEMLADQSSTPFHEYQASHQDIKSNKYWELFPKLEGDDSIYHKSEAHHHHHHHHHSGGSHHHHHHHGHHGPTLYDNITSHMDVANNSEGSNTNEFGTKLNVRRSSLGSTPTNKNTTSGLLSSSSSSVKKRHSEHREISSSTPRPSNLLERQSSQGKMKKHSSLEHEKFSDLDNLMQGRQFKQAEKEKNLVNDTTDAASVTVGATTTGATDADATTGSGSNDNADETPAHVDDGVVDEKPVRRRAPQRTSNSPPRARGQTPVRPRSTPRGTSPARTTPTSAGGNANVTVRSSSPVRNAYSDTTVGEGESYMSMVSNAKTPTARKRSPRVVKQQFDTTSKQSEATL